MTKIAVIHPDLGMRGGAENVCLHVLEALQTNHELTLFTLSNPNIAELNQYFRTDVRPPNIEIAGHLGPILNQQAGHRFGKLQAALLGRYVSRQCTQYDLVISTKNEFVVDVPSIQYIHSPQFATADPGIDRSNVLQHVYDYICRKLAGISESRLRQATYLTNSEWSANVLKEVYGVSAETVYPPVHTTVFPKQAWDERENGFVSIGRVGPSKHLLENIDVIERLRQRGHDTHLHIVGPTTDDEYSARVERASASREFISVEGALDRADLISLITSHRYGLHGRPYEHFGIAVAELTAGGAIPFAPNSGGQREILDKDQRLLYSSIDDAVEKIDTVLSEPETQTALQRSLNDITATLGRERFISEIQRTTKQVMS